MLRLPDAGRAQIDRRKIARYLLSDVGPEGRHKARVFQSTGFTASNREVLRAALPEHAADRDLVGGASTAYGQRYLVRCESTAPAGQSRCFITVWQREPGSSSPRFITAYPA